MEHETTVAEGVSVAPLGALLHAPVRATTFFVVKLTTPFIQRTIDNLRVQGRDVYAPMVRVKRRRTESTQLMFARCAFVADDGDGVPCGVETMRDLTGAPIYVPLSALRQVMEREDDDGLVRLDAAVRTGPFASLFQPMDAETRALVFLRLAEGSA